MQVVDMTDHVTALWFSLTYMCFACRRRKVDTEEPPGAEASGAVGLHGSFQNKQRSPGGYQLTWTVRSPISSAPQCPSPLHSPLLCQLSHQTTRHTYHNHQQLSVGLLWQQSPRESMDQPCTFPLLRTPTYNHIEYVCSPTRQGLLQRHCRPVQHTRFYHGHMELIFFHSGADFLSFRSQMQIYFHLVSVRKRNWGKSASSVGRDTSCIIESTPSSRSFN